MDQKQNNETTSAPTSSTQKEAPKGNNKVLFWILGGCLALLVIFGLVLGGIAYWSYKKVKKGIEENKPKMSQSQNQAEKNIEDLQNTNGSAQVLEEEIPQTISEEPSTNSDAPQSAEGALPFAGEKQIGYVKKVYTKSGKNYLEIDYIQWLSGAEAQKAMREDGACPKTGECIVYNDYYIRNANPLIRTFEMSPDVEITMQTYDMETTGQIQAQPISLSQFSQIWGGSAKPNLKKVPYIIEISSNQITKINEQYIP
jgi:hypothetical protein